MTKTNQFVFITVLGIFMSRILVAADETNDLKNGLLAGLKSHYEITTRSWFGKVQKPGTVLTVQQDGISADVPKGLMKPTIIEDGKITKTGGGDILLGQGGRSLKQGEKVYIYDIRVKADYVLFLIATVTTIDIQRNGRTEAVAQEAAVSFHMNTTSTNMTTESVIAAIRPWVASEAEAAAATTVSLGQTTAEVKKELGQPGKVAELGPKAIYYYKDMKVIFTDGKVTDVE